MPTPGNLIAQRYPAGMPVTQVVAIVSAMASALDYAHKRGLLHRDVKPANIILTHDDDEGEQRILLADFGIARSVDDLSGLTATNMTIGTVAYSAPEQLMGEAVDGRADQYALAATAYHLLTGSQLFPHTNPAVVISRHLNTPPPRVADLRPDLRNLDQVLSVALEKDPSDRFARCSDFARALAEQVAPQAVAPSDPTAAAPAARRPAIKPPSSGGPPTTAPPKARPAAPMPQPRRNIGWIVASTAAAIILVVAGVTLAVVGTSSSPDRSATSTQSGANAASPNLLVTEPPGCGDGQALLAAMTPRDKLAQLLMVGVTGADDARQVVATQHVGGIMVGGHTDMSLLTDGSLADIAASADPLPLAVSVDEEGGRVERLSKLIGDQPSPRVLARTKTPAEVHDIALQRGQAMKKLGITVDFAPVADVTTEGDDEVIGDRSFGADPDTVIKYAGAYAQGLRDAGLLPVLKHFPGHGHAATDAVVGDVMTPALPDLKASDLVPYGTLTNEAPVAVMMGHLEVPGLTTDEPTSLTPAAYDLLRSGGYGGPPFDGPVFTDDLTGVSNRFAVPDAALEALQAGADVALWATTDQVPAVLDRLTAAVNSGELKQADVDRSVLRVAGFKGKSTHCGG